MDGSFLRAPIRWPRVLPVLMALLAAGCAKTTGEVSGLVTYNGEPLPSGSVSFLGDADSNKDKVESTGISADGSYRLSRVLCGNVRIAVQTPPVVEGQFAGASIPSIEIPRRYADPKESGLTYTVTPGPQSFDIKLSGPALRRTRSRSVDPASTPEMKERMKRKNSP